MRGVLRGELLSFDGGWWGTSGKAEKLCFRRDEGERFQSDSSVVELISGGSSFDSFLSCHD